MRNSPLKLILLVALLFLLNANSQENNLTLETKIDLCSNGTEEICDAFNSTELSTEPTTEVSSVVTRKAVNKKQKTTVKPNKKIPTQKQNRSSTLQPQAECTCDLTRGNCEVNCCCDVDCSESQRNVFTRCIALGTAVDTDYCVPPQLLYHNNTDYQVVMTDGMLCVVRQNTHVTTDYKDVPVVKSLSTIKSKVEKHKHYSWPHSRVILPVFDPDLLYKDGSPVWISDNNTITYLAFPTSGGYSTFCLSSVLVKYLVDIDTSCTVPLQNKTDCLVSSNINFTVISSPRNFNFTGPQECTNEVCLPIRQFICTHNCFEGKIPSQTFNSSSQLCINVVTSVEYIIYHNGTQGIVEVRAFNKLSNISLQESQVIRQSYRVTYKWAGNDGEVMGLRRSGHPGYERGRPVISGRRTGKVVVLNTSTTDWISFPVAGTSGQCETRHSLMFGENVKSLCTVKLSGTCKQMQHQLWQHMLGPGGNVSDMVISAYGDPQVNDTEMWVPLLLSDDLPTTPYLVSSVDIVLLHTLVGPLDRPVTKIVGAYLRVLPSEVSCSSNTTQGKVKVSVKFVDKTVAPVTKFAPPPVYEIKLPQDFFYPFLSSGGIVCVGLGLNMMVVSIVVMIG